MQSTQILDPVEPQADVRLFQGLKFVGVELQLCLLNFPDDFISEILIFDIYFYYNRPETISKILIFLSVVITISH